jgi:hypothetical protein
VVATDMVYHDYKQIGYSFGSDLMTNALISANDGAKNLAGPDTNYGTS